MSQAIVRGKTSAVSLEGGALYLIALGSNLNFDSDTPEGVLRTAFALLEKRAFVIRSCSRFFNTPAFPAGYGPDFVNAAACVEHRGTVMQVITHLHDVEAQMGRARQTRWGARTLDLDLIAAGNQVLPDAKTHQYWRDLPLETQKTAVPSELIVPHPRLAERAFVLVPLMDIAPDWCHPVTKRTIRQMHDALPAAMLSEVVAL